MVTPNFFTRVPIAEDEKCIQVVEDEMTRIYKDADKREYFFNKFKNIFAPSGASKESIGDWSNIFSDSSLLGSKHLTTPFTMDKIKKATFQLEDDKVQGPNGFNLLLKVLEGGQR